MSPISIAFDTTNTANQAALFALRDAVDAGSGMVGDVASADRSIKLAEQLRRLAAVASVDSMQAVEDARVYVDQGHASARVMVAHLAGLSSSDAFRLDKIRRMVHGRRADQIAVAWCAGSLGVDQAVVLARVYANPRVRDRFIDDQAWFLARATKDSFAKFEKRIARWLELADDDGADPAPDPTFESRDASLSQDHFSKAWHLRSQLGSVGGSRFNEVFGAYVEAEYALDRDAARERCGDAATADDLPRTAAQRRADALCQMAEDAANNPSTSVRVKRVHNLIWKGETAEELFRRWNGLAPRTINIDDYGVADLDGHVVHAPTAFAELLVDSFRRVVVNAAGVVVDMSRSQRLFTGLARLGVELQTDECYWPGCHKPTSACQIDHLRPAARGGPTTQSNGKPACLRHNLVKEAGYTVTRAPDGAITITTPNGETVR